MPQITFVESEERVLHEALIGDLKNFKTIDTMTKEVVVDTVNGEVARSVLESSIET